VSRWLAILALVAALLPLEARGNPPQKASGAAATAWHTRTVVRGESLSEIAREIGCTVADLKRWNRSLRDPVKPGMKLRYQGRRLRPESVGHCWNGQLAGAARMPADGRGYLMSPDRTRVWATPETVKLVRSCLASYRATYPKGPPISVGDLSDRTGGPASPHVSHQSGRDVDIGYLTNPPQSPGTFDRVATPGNLDVGKHWFLTKCFLDQPAIQAIFIESSLVSAMRAYIERIYKKNPAKKRKYLKYFATVLKPDGEHRTHMHVRYKCPPGNRRCQD
jgi:murein endopeptidase